MDELRLSKEFAEMIVDTVREGLLVLDWTLRVQSANESFYQLFGASREETEGRLVYQIGNGEWDIPELRELLEGIVPDNEFFNDYEVDHQFKRLGRRVMMLNARRLNHHKLILLAIEDVTERKQAESELRDLNAELEQRIDHRTLSLATALGKLELDHQDAQRFVQIASHDLQEPLREILNFSARLGQSGSSTLSEAGKHDLTRLQGEATRLQALIYALLEFSRITTSGSPFVMVELGKIVGEVLTNLRPQIEETGARIEVGELPKIEADPAQMGQLFRNLILNALTFRKPDQELRIEIYARTDTDGQTASPGRPAGRVRIAVADNGIGFEEKYLAKIFSPFQQLQRRSEQRGVGMGLAVCKKIAERHNGSITAESTPGKGSTFFVTLPISQQE